MYTRTYFTEDKSVDIPENYNGNAFRDEVAEEKETENESEAFFKSEEEKEAIFARMKKKNPFAAIIEKTPLSNIFRSLRESEKRAIRFSTEEILITTIALYMFFSKDGDKECALMLLFLLFI